MLKFFLLIFSGCCFTMYLPAQIVPGELLLQLEKNYSPVQIERSFAAEAGILPDFKVVQCVSEPMRVWLFSFRPDEIAATDALLTAQRLRGVSIAQWNHQIEQRSTIPDDPFFGMQWHHIDPQDNDIDSDLAWDITTGGTTSTGDKIVACIVEMQGAKWSQEDIAPNHWTNTHEVPNNQIDDDGNGYVDDYDGWNVTNHTDHISTDNHGTQVSSMMGAKGNNTTGIVGVNWDVGLMQVQIGSATEARAIEAYTYPLVMRKLYNETHGQKGAFVVVTNSSWGIDGGQPAHSPLWCAMYDSLGYYGVLSCAATTNSNVNVDNAGDMPTGCPSNYLIAVTATNSSDVRTFSGYGTTTVDLAAPGGSVYLAGNVNYGNASGTSFASPCVAGAVALLYSAPCNSLMQMAYSDPAYTASAVRGYILNGVDAVANLQTETATGGRLNVFNSLNLLLNDCNQNACIPPFNISLAYTDPSVGYQVNWAVAQTMTNFSLRYRPLGENNWTTVEYTSLPPFTIHHLLYCTDYELQMMAICTNGESDWSPSYIWKTEGCCKNPTAYELVSIGENEVTLAWENIIVATGYDLHISTGEGDTGTTFLNIVDSSFAISGLDACTTYFGTVTAHCVANEPPPVTVFPFHTVGCLTCTEINYCNISASAELEWIKKVELGSISNTSGSDNGYGNYTHLSTVLQPGQTYTITCTPGYAGFAYSEYFKAWIDYNGDGIFDPATELVFDPGISTTTTIFGAFTVPQNLYTGSRRLRVGMSYRGVSSGSEPIPCGEISFGETEDYCVMIDSTLSIKQPIASEKFYLYPNPAKNELSFSAPHTWCQSCSFFIYDISGRKIRSGNQPKENRWDISTLPVGFYTMKIINPEKSSVFSAPFTVVP